VIEPTRTRRTTIWHTIAVAIVAVLWQLPYFDRWMSPMDEGHIVAFADMLAKGGELYRDASLLPLPGAFYLLELAFELLGPSIRLARWIVVLEFALLSVVAFSLLRRLVPLGWAWVGVASLLLYRIWVFPHWHMYSYSTTSLVALACALLALVSFLETGRARALVLAGLGTGLGALCKQDYGAAGWIAMNVILVAAIVSIPRGERPNGWRPVVWYNAPAVLIGLLTALHFLRQGLFLEMVRQTVLNHLIGIATFEYTSMPPILPLFEQEPLLRGGYGFYLYAPSIVSTLDWARIVGSAWYRDTFLWDLAIKLCYYAPYLGAAVAIVRMWRLRSALADGTRRSAYLAELAISVYGVLLLASLSKPVNWIHLWVLCWPLVCLLVVYVRALHDTRPRVARAAAALACLPVLAAAAYTAHLALELRTQFSAPLPTARSGIYVRPREARVIREAVGYMQTHSQKGEPFAVLPYYPLLSFLADRPAPHRAAWVFWPVEDVPNRQQEIIQLLEDHPTRHLIYQFTQAVEFPNMQEFAPDLFAYLVGHYEIDRVFQEPCRVVALGGLTRTPAPPRGRAIISREGSDAELRVERPGQPPHTVPEARRGQLLGAERWPFRDVLAVRPGTCDRRVVFAAPVQATDASRLRTTIGVHPNQWCDDPSVPVTFAIRAVSEGHHRLLYTRTLDPRRRHADRGSFEVDVSLAEFAGQSLELEFVTGCDGRSGEGSQAGGWEIPRIEQATVLGKTNSLRVP
jgi:hypothetical protein